MTPQQAMMYENIMGVGGLIFALGLLVIWWLWMEWDLAKRKDDKAREKDL